MGAMSNPARATIRGIESAGSGPPVTSGRSITGEDRTPTSWPSITYRYRSNSRLSPALAPISSRAMCRPAAARETAGRSCAERAGSFVCVRWVASNPRAEDYAAFRAAGRRFGAGWPAWPEGPRDGRLAAGDFDPEVKRYHLYAQWLAHRQLAGVSERARGRGVRLYLDLPLGVNPDSGEQLWSCATDIGWYMVPSIVNDKDVVYCIGGRGSGGALAVRAGGSGDVTLTHRLWRSNKGSNVPSPAHA